MCGRYTRYWTWREVVEASAPLQVLVPGEDPTPAYNFAPTQAGWVLVAGEDGQAVAREMAWGLIPHWAAGNKRMAYSTINARVETAATKPAFRSAWKHRRCLVPASGYFEWPEIAGEKQPHYIQLAGNELVMFAGLWEPDAEGDPDTGGTYAIVTMDAAGPVAKLHDRMPLILPQSMFTDWLFGDAQKAAEIAIAAPTPKLKFHRVKPQVGNVRNQGPDLIEPI